MNVPISREQLEQHLNEQLGFIADSCCAFDRGKEQEAKRISTSLRVIFYDSRTSHSILKQLNARDTKMLDTSAPLINGNLSGIASLVAMGMGGKERGGFLAPLNGCVRKHMIPLENWWNQVVIREPERESFSRGRLIITIANTDGGAHVDPGIGGDFLRVREAALGYSFYSPNGMVVPNNLHLVTIRQIAHEVLCSFGVIHDSNEEGPETGFEVVLQGTGMIIGISPKKIGRNDDCPCDSGLKFKRCHGCF